MMKILITGFDPFEKEKVNPSYEAVKLLPDTIAGAEIIKLEIPTVFADCLKPIEKAVEQYHPDAIICIGQAGGRSCLTIEKVGINIMDARIPDNSGAQPIDVPVVAGGPDAYFATIPVKAMMQNVRDHNMPCFVSYTAGTFVCNAVMYMVLHMCAVQYPDIRAGFMHVPYENSQAIDKLQGTPSMSLKDIAVSIEYAVEALVKNESDIAVGGGTTH